MHQTYPRVFEKINMPVTQGLAPRRFLENSQSHKKGTVPISSQRDSCPPSFPLNSQY